MRYTQARISIIFKILFCRRKLLNVNSFLRFPFFLFPGSSVSSVLKQLKLYQAMVTGYWREDQSAIRHMYEV